MKKDNWEELYAKDLEKLESTINEKADKITIAELNNNIGAVPNIYTTQTIDVTNDWYITLGNIKDPSIYNEYIIEVKCTSTPSRVHFVDIHGTEIAINWANDNIPVFEEGYTYIISIVNNFGVFAQFTNS